MKYRVCPGFGPQNSTSPASGIAPSGKDQDSESKELRVTLRPSGRSSQLLVGDPDQETGRDPLFWGFRGEALTLHGVRA